MSNKSSGTPPDLRTSHNADDLSYIVAYTDPIDGNYASWAERMKHLAKQFRLQQGYDKRLIE